MSTVTIPATCLVVLIGVSGSGKTTFAARHFGPYETISSDHCRGIVSNDENDQTATRDAFEVLNFLVAARLRRHLLTVVDATNVQRDARASLIRLAKAHDVLPVAVVLDVPESVAVTRNKSRADRDFPERVITRQRSALRQSLRGLEKEGFRSVHVLRGVEQIDTVTIDRKPLLSDHRDDSGPFDVIGDVHGCLPELVALLEKLGYDIHRDEQGTACDAQHPEGRRVIFLGDLIDRGPDTVGVLRLAMGMVNAGHAVAVPGNHEHKLVRALNGNKVTLSHGLETTMAELATQTPEFREQVRNFCHGLVSHLVFDGGRLVVAHAGLKEEYHLRASGRVRSFALYGDTTGETDEFGLPVRYPWAIDYRGSAMVLYGHTPTPQLDWVNNTLCLDTGCVFGGKLSALRYPERETVQVSAARTYYEPARPFAIEDGPPEDAHRHPQQLDVADVLGRTVIDTRTRGPITIAEDQAAGALEVMSRYAIDPRLMAYLPPTMSPVETSTEPGYLEYPTEAFDHFARSGVDTVICEEKHMGSRAVLLIARDSGESAPHIIRDCYGMDAPGAVYSRTGRAFFPAELMRAFLAKTSHALSEAGVFAELDADWVLLDAEILPWSVKARQLIIDHYASVGAAATAIMPEVVAALAAAAGRGLEVAELMALAQERQANAEALVRAYQPYQWTTEGLAGVEVAPFQVLASGRRHGPGHTYATRDHRWHLGIGDRLAEVAPSWVRTTRRQVVELADPVSRAQATSWWLELTATGGEGMVVKPVANLTRRPDTRSGQRGDLVQPGLKVRGREYLRIIYGPDYLMPANLDRLRQRQLGRKRSLALREYALGLEALDRFVAGEPLWRVHEAVFAVLALESEPVDPRL